MRSVSSRSVLAGLLVVALLLAGVASYYASADPDGLERVSEDHGFSGTAEDHAVADGPLADYQTAGIDDERVSGGVAGVAGALVVLAVAGGVAYAVRRKPDQPAGSSADAVTDGLADRAAAEPGGTRRRG